MVLLGSIGSVNGITSEVIAQNIKGIDLIIDGAGAKAPAGGKKVGDTLIVSAGAGLTSVGVVDVHVKDNMVAAVTPVRINASDVKDPAASALAKWAGVTAIPADAGVQAYIDYQKGQLAKMTKVVEAKPAPVAEAKPAVAVPVPMVPAAPAIDKDIIVKSNDGLKEFDLYVVHTNDVHGRIEEGDGIGYAKLATLVKMGRSVTDKDLLLDAGDVTHGTTLTNLFQGETAGVLLDMLGYDAVVPGNHDFNYGKERLIEAAKLAEKYSNIKVLSANILDENGQMVFQPYQLYYFDGFCGRCHRSHHS